MAAIRKDLYKGIESDIKPSLTVALRNIATDLAAINGTKAVAAPAAQTSAVDAALTSSQNATANGSDAGTTETLANALKVSYNALQADVVALRTAYDAAQADITALYVTVNALRTALNAGAGATLLTTAP